MRNNRSLKTFLLLLLSGILLLGGTGSALAGPGPSERQVFNYTSMTSWPEIPEITAECAYMVELNSGAVLLDKNSEEVSFPASTTKIMTALLALENCQLDERITLSHDAIYDLEEGGHHYDFEEGETLTVDECLRFLMVESVNEVAYALAEHIAGSVEAFSEMMNQRAKDFGATHTHFMNPHGLNNPEHVTTAKDMALILWGCVQNEQFCYYASLPSVSGIRGRSVRTEEDFPAFYNHHLMLRESSEDYDPDVVCGKTGFTSLAGQTLVTYAAHGNMDVVCVLMKGANDRFKDTEILLNYAWDNFTARSTAEMAQELMADTAEPFSLEESTAAGTEIVLPNSFPFQLTRTLLKTSFSVSGPSQDNLVTGERLWKLGEQVIQREVVQKEIIPESETAVETEASGKKKHEDPYKEPEGFLYEEVFGWRVMHLLLLGGLGLLFLVLLTVLFGVTHAWLGGKKDARREEKKRRGGIPMGHNWIAPGDEEDED